MATEPIIVPVPPPPAVVQARFGDTDFTFHLTHAAARAGRDAGVDVYEEIQRFEGLAVGGKADIHAIKESVARLLYVAALAHHPLATVDTFADALGLVPSEATMNAVGNIVARLLTPSVPVDEEEGESVPATPGKRASRSRTPKA